MLIENTLLGVVDKVDIAIRRLKSFEPEDGYYVAFGGGKDSIVVLDLVKRSGVKYDAHYTITSVDAFAGRDSKGLNLVPVQNGKSRQLIRKEET